MTDFIHIPSTEALRDMNETELRAFCDEIRSFLVEQVSVTGGHLASNLGVVELTVAIHRVFDTSKDRLVFDVGHQSYVHKILTGRAERFPTLRKLDGLAGFPKPSESKHDAFIAGHASNSVSVALGMARARTLRGDDYNVIALMGDGALTGGLAYEGLNDAGSSGEPLIVILNDNGMSIKPNVGAMAKHLSNIRQKPSYYQLKKAWRSATKNTEFGRALYNGVHHVKEGLKKRLISSNMFNDMGYEYFGPVDGHDVEKLTWQLRQARDLKKPVILHVITQKGRGYAPAEKNPDRFHGVGPFDPKTGVPLAGKKPCFSDSFGQALTALADADPRVCAITAAMQSGTGLDPFAAKYPERFGDVGIAEGHAVAMAAGLAKQGMIPVVALYSTFLQRAFDMMIHDVALLNLHVVFAVDRAGLVGADGETHHGVFDVGYLRQVPGMKIFCPANQAELVSMLKTAVLELEGPVAIRYPRGGDGRYTEQCTEPILRQGRDITLCAYGTMINPVLDAADLLAADGIEAEVVKLNTIRPISALCKSSARKTGAFLMAEECPTHSGIFDEIAADPALSGVKKCGLDLGVGFIQHGTVPELLHRAGLDAEHIRQSALALLQK
ncbi:MAG: 1-deoxy-D-xylulose-5-phosphate synthase [Oscillospiraceae bacterium]|nr:1-deoxy-D-xylulose-5-phosphate synthase [Oscillospiraceae bacterium]